MTLLLYALYLRCKASARWAKRQEFASAFTIKIEEEWAVPAADSHVDFEKKNLSNLNVRSICEIVSAPKKQQQKNEI